jgi:Flp pilus assembly protein TadG
VTGRGVARRRADDCGAGYVAAFIVLFAVMVLGGVGVIVDSARFMSAQRHASSVAFEAARAGAQAVQVGSARGGDATIDDAAARIAAIDAARRLLAGSGASVTGVKVTAGEVRVTVTRHVDAWFPLLASRTVLETGTARIVTGVTGEGQ